MKYEFKKIDLDNFEFIYTSKNNEQKVIPFKRTIEMATKIQGINASARIKMFKELTSLGMTKNDLIIRKDDGKGHITYDETNYQEFEKKYIEEESMKTMNDIINETLKMNMLDLFEDMGMNLMKQDNEVVEQISLFTQKFVTIISQEQEKTPSGENN